MGIERVDHDGQWLEVWFDDGTTERFLAAWLRDNATSGRHQANGQRTFDINALPKVSIDVATHGVDTVTVEFGPDGHEECFRETWLRDAQRSDAMAAVSPEPTLWGAELQDSLSFVDYRLLERDPAALSEWLIGLRDLGFGLLENVPTVPGSIRGVVDLFGFIRQTNYGQIFDVRAEPNPANLAFTTLGIGMHTDNPYRDPVPGLQLLHCLVNESDGGDNRLCDGLAVAEQVRREHPEAFSLLTSHPVCFRYVEEGSADLQTYVPLIGLDCSGKTVAVRYNSRSAQAFDMATDVLADYYEAFRIFGEALHAAEAIVEFRLDAGQMIVFDNQRVLHGRSGYTTGARHLQGCYADKDSLKSRIRVLSKV